MTTPIVVQFKNGACTWRSVGWGKDKATMAKARQAINNGKDPEDVVQRLQEAGFEVIQVTTGI